MDARPLIDYLFGVWRGSVQAPGLPLSRRLPASTGEEDDAHTTRPLTPPTGKFQVEAFLDRGQP
jgi:hypothetical protein